MPSFIRLLHENDSNKKNNIFHDVISTTRTCSDAGISPRFCLCSKWIKSTEPPFAMLETLIARMNRGIRENSFARSQCEILHLSRIIDTRVLSRSTFLSHHGPHLTSQRYRFRFLVYGKGPVVDMYEADVVNFIWQIERSSSSSSVIDFRDHNQVKRMKDSGTILENVYVPLIWKQIRDDNVESDECSRFVDVPCICRQSERKRKTSELDNEVAFLYHTDSSKAYVVVNKNELKIIRRIYGKVAESFEIYNGRDEDIVFVLSLRDEKTDNLLSSRPMPVSVIVRKRFSSSFIYSQYLFISHTRKTKENHALKSFIRKPLPQVPSRRRRHVVTLEQGDLTVPWKRSIRWKWHALRSDEVVKSPLDFTFAGSLDTSNVSYIFNDGVAVWRVFDTSGNFMFEKYPTMNVYARNMRESKIVIRIALHGVENNIRVMSCDDPSLLRTDVLVDRLDSKSESKCLLRVALVETKSGAASTQYYATLLKSIRISWDIQGEDML